MTPKLPKIIVKSLYVFCCYTVFLNEWQLLTTLDVSSSANLLNCAASQPA